MDLPTLTRALEAKRAELPGLKAAAEAKQLEVRAAFKNIDVPEGVDREQAISLAVLGNAEAFSRVDAAWKPYSEAARDLDVQTQNLMSMYEQQGFHGGGSPFAPQHSPGAPETGERFNVRNIGAKASALFLGSDVYAEAKEWARSSPGPLGVTKGVQVMTAAEFKTLVTGLSKTSGGAFVENDRQDFLSFLAQRPLVAAMVGQATTDSDTVEYVEQTAFTNNAAATAEGTAANESAVTYVVRTVPVEEITHFIPSTKRAIADAGELQGLLEQDLILGVLRALDQEILSGDGSTPNLEGIYNAGSVQTQALGSDTRADCLHKAITKIRIAFGEPDGVLFNPADYQDLRLEKDGMGRYLFGDPAGPGATGVWGVPWTQSSYATSGTPIVGDFRMGSRLSIREGVSVAMSDSHANYFTERKVALLASMRAAFKVRRPTHFCTPTGF